MKHVGINGVVKRKQYLSKVRLAVVTIVLLAAIFLTPSGFSGQDSCYGKQSPPPGGAWRGSRLFSPYLDWVDSREFSLRMKETVLVSRIDSFFESMNSPLTGMGDSFVQAQNRTGVSAPLLVALTLAESSCATAGSLPLTNHNAWGMKGPQPALGIPAENGYCLWPDWSSAINGAAEFVAHYWGAAQTGRDLKGYARQSGPGSSWLTRVEDARTRLACR